MPHYSEDEDEIDRIARNPHPQRLPKNNDSSSSRESSPDSRKRSFTPMSDDGDMQIPSIPDDDTPPPPDKPVIRQALAFDGSSTSTNLNTYQAKPPTVNAIFLPGQTVAPPPKPPKKPKQPKKPRKKDPYGTQAGRFRLSDWSTLPEAPASVSQPTHDMHPIDVGNAHTMASQLPPSNIMHVPPSAPSVPQTMSYLSNTQYTSGFTPTPAPQPHVLGNFSFPNPIASSSKGKAKALPSKNTTKTAKQKVKPATSSRSNTVSSIGDRPSSAYYRRDYQSQVDIDYDTMSTGSGAGPSSSQVPHHLPKHKSDHLSVKQSKPSRPSSRMVTILLTDIRSGVEDHQLAEVVVPLKDADTEHPEHGFWANAQEVVEKLQSTPSRIEGPARVYTMRGKYRQFFLRVHDDESNEVYPANLSVSEERTLEVVVETAPLPGELPAPPRIPRDLQPTPEPDDASSNSQYYEAREYNKNGRKRHRSPSDRSTVDYDGSYSIASPERQPSPNGSSSHHSTKKKKISENANEDEVNDSDAELFITPLSKTGQDWPFDYDSPTSDGDEDLDVKIVERLEPVLQMHPVEGLWESVFPLRRRLPRVSAYILLYRALEQFFEKYEGRRVPFKRNRNIRIQKIHILKALGVLDETDEFSDLADADKICANCSETLRLVSLYGPEGSRLQDPTVLEMIKDEDVKSPEGKPQKRFLRLLREVDEKWKAEHAEEPESNGEIRPPPEVASVDSSNNNSGDTRVSVE